MENSNLFKSFKKTLSHQKINDKENNKTPIMRQIYNALSELNQQEVELHDVIQRNVFMDIDFYNLNDLVPLWIRDAGHSQESSISNIDFEKLVKRHNNKLTHKFLYYHDCEALMSAFQNRTAGLNTMLSRVFQTLTTIFKYSIQEYENVCLSASEINTDVYVNLNSIIITLASSFDLLTKVAYELQEMSTLSFESYPKMKSVNITYGDKVRLVENLQVDNSIFAKKRPLCIEIVESLRNEIIHNGSLDFHDTLYYGIKEDVIEYWIYAPEFDKSGRLSSYNGRKKFYSNEKNTFNKLLPELMLDVIKYLQNTFELLISIFDTKITTNENEFINYNHEISRWYSLH